MSGNVSVQSGHLSSPQQQSVTQIQLQQQLQQQQPQPDPTKSVQWQISTSSAGSASAGSHASQQSVNKVSWDPIRQFGTNVKWVWFTSTREKILYIY